MRKHAVIPGLFIILFLLPIVAVLINPRAHGQEELYPCPGPCTSSECGEGYQQTSNYCPDPMRAWICCVQEPIIPCQWAGGYCTSGTCVSGYVGGSGGNCPAYQYCCYPEGTCEGPCVEDECPAGYIPADGTCHTLRNCCVWDASCPGGTCTEWTDNGNGGCRDTEIPSGDGCTGVNDGKTCCIIDNEDLVISCGERTGCGTETGFQCGDSVCYLGQSCTQYYNCIGNPPGSNNCPSDLRDCEINTSWGCVNDASFCEGCQVIEVTQDTVCPDGDKCWVVGNPSYGQCLCHDNCGGVACCQPTGGGGATPTPTPANGTANARAHIVPSATTTCGEVEASGTFLPITLSIVSGGTSYEPQSIAGGTYATWAVVGDQTYSVDDTPTPSGYVLKLACHTNGTGISAFIGGGQTVTWELGYSLGTPWFQVGGGGDAYAQTSIRSYIPAAASPQYFSLDGTGGSPGFVQYGTSYDFDSSPTGEGETLVSSNGWLTNDTTIQPDYYAIMYKRFGSPATPDYSGGTTVDSLSDFTSLAHDSPYYVTGDLTIDGADWAIGPGQRVVVIVDGNLTIRNRINHSSGGFVAFIVNGNITVDSSVGVTWDSSLPVLSGVYITSPDGIFVTGPTIAAGSARFVGRGIFIAGGFAMQRNLDIISHNTDTAAELFLYNPRLLITMPDEMKDVPITWQEVAP
jgi:hypothetical protein